MHRHSVGATVQDGPDRQIAGDGEANVGAHHIAAFVFRPQLLADSVLALLSGCEAASVIPAYERTRDRLSHAMFDAIEAVAGYDWTLAEVRHLLREVSAAMGDEVDHLQSLSQRHG